MQFKPLACSGLGVALLLDIAWWWTITVVVPKFLALHHLLLNHVLDIHHDWRWQPNKWHFGCLAWLVGRLCAGGDMGDFLIHPFGESELLKSCRILFHGWLHTKEHQKAIACLSSSVWRTQCCRGQSPSWESSLEQFSSLGRCKQAALLWVPLLASSYWVGHFATKFFGGLCRGQIVGSAVYCWNSSHENCYVF